MTPHPLEDLLAHFVDRRFVGSCKRLMAEPVREAFEILVEGVGRAPERKDTPCSVAELARIQRTSKTTAARRVDQCRRAVYAVLRRRREREARKDPVARAEREQQRVRAKEERARAKEALKQQRTKAKADAIERRRLAPCVDTGARAKLLYFGRCRRLTSAIKTDNSFYRMMIKDPVSHAWLYRVADEMALQARQRMDGPPPPAPTVCPSEWKRARTKGKVSR